MKRFHLVLAVFFAALLLGASTTLAADAIKVGIILPLTGANAPFGEIEKNSFVMALEEINKTGINGKKLEFVFEDDTGRPEVARSAAEKLITKDNVVMLGGGYGSSETFAISGVAQQNKIPFLINTGSDDKITEQKWDYIYRLNPTASDYPLALESYLVDVVKAKTAVIIYENSNFGTSSSRSFEKTCEKLGVKILMKEGYEKGGIDFKPILMRVKQANPDLVYMISYIMDASLLMKQSMELRLSPKLFVGGGAGFTLPEFQKNAGKAAEKVFSATLWYQTLKYPGAMDYFKAYEKRFKKETEYHGAEAYAAAFVIADALKRAKSMSRDDIKASLSATNIQTVFGPVKFVSFDKKTNQNKLPTYLVQWINGELELVWPKEIATKPAAYPIDWAKEWK